MRDLFSLLPPEEAFRRLEPYLRPLERTERIATREALGRVLREDIFAGENLPSFPRSAMDGYAVRAEDTYGASESQPVALKVIGEVPMGRPAGVKVSAREAAVVHTGGMLAEGADAVVMVENTQAVDPATVEVMRAVAVGENVLQTGEDIRQGELLLPAGCLLRPQDIGALLALGVTAVTVSPPVRVALIASGDELVPPERQPEPGQVRDINTYTLSALAQRAGATPLPLGIVGDDYQALRAATERGMREADIVVIAAGSSVSTRDMTAQVISSLGEPGILVHGIAVKPGKPTILAMAGEKPVFGLPGNPVSAMVLFELVIVPTLCRLSGCRSLPQPSLREARLSQNIPSAAGREEYVPVRLEERDGELWAEPIFGKSNFISILVRAEGMVQVPLDKVGLQAGEKVQVKLF
jgi:molybdopterin molybdotransferase